MPSFVWCNGLFFYHYRSVLERNADSRSKWPNQARHLVPNFQRIPHLHGRNSWSRFRNTLTSWRLHRFISRTTFLGSQVHLWKATASAVNGHTCDGLTRAYCREFLGSLQVGNLLVLSRACRYLFSRLMAPSTCLPCRLSALICRVRSC